PRRRRPVSAGARRVTNLIPMGRGWFGRVGNVLRARLLKDLLGVIRFVGFFGVNADKNIAFFHLAFIACGLVCMAPGPGGFQIQWRWDISGAEVQAPPAARRSPCQVWILPFRLLGIVWKSSISTKRPLSRQRTARRSANCWLTATRPFAI